MRTEAQLTTNLQDLVLYDNEPDAINAWAFAFAEYFKQAVTGLVLNVPIVPAAVDGIAKPAMVTGMAGLSVTGALAIQNGITMFWSTMAAAPISFFPACLSITPPAGLSGIQSALQSIFDLNKGEGADKNTSMQRIAQVIHAQNAGGTATFPGVPNPIVETIL